MTIEGVYKLEIQDLEEDYPDQKNEYRVSKVIELAYETASRILDEGTENHTEYLYAQSALAHQLVNRMMGDRSAALLKERLEARFPPKIHGSK